MGNRDIVIFSGVAFHMWQVKVMKKGLWSVVKPEGEVESTSTIRGKSNAFASQDENSLGILLTSLANDIVHYLDEATSSQNAEDIVETTFGAKSKHSKIFLKM